MLYNDTNVVEVIQKRNILYISHVACMRNGRYPHGYVSRIRQNGRVRKNDCTTLRGLFSTGLSLMAAKRFTTDCLLYTIWAVSKWQLCRHNQDIEEEEKEERKTVRQQLSVPFLLESVAFQVLRRLPDSCEGHAGRQCERNPRNSEAPDHHTTCCSLVSYNQNKHCDFDIHLIYAGANKRQEHYMNVILADRN